MSTTEAFLLGFLSCLATQGIALWLLARQERDVFEDKK